MTKNSGSAPKCDYCDRKTRNPSGWCGICIRPAHVLAAGARRDAVAALRAELYEPRSPQERADAIAVAEWGAGSTAHELVPGVYEVIAGPAVPDDPDARVFDFGGYVAIVGTADMPEDLVDTARRHGLVERHRILTRRKRRGKVTETDCYRLPDDPDPDWLQREADYRSKWTEIDDVEVIVGSDLDHGWRIVALTAPAARDDLRARTLDGTLNGDPEHFTEAGMLADVEAWGFTDYAADYRRAVGLPQPTPQDRCTFAAGRIAARAERARTPEQQAIKTAQARTLTEAAHRLSQPHDPPRMEEEFWAEARRSTDRALTAATPIAGALAIGERAGWLAGIEALRGGRRLAPQEIAVRLTPQEQMTV